MKKVRHMLEAATLFLALGLFRALPPDAASNLGGWIGRTLGPRHGVSRRARGNLALAMPELSAREVERIVRDMWDNLGRVAAEYPHLDTIANAASGRVELVGVDQVRGLAEAGRAAVLAGAHLANWEVLPVAAAQNGIDMTSIVREPNNPLVRPVLDRLRGVAGGTRVPKGKAGAKEAIDVLRDGRVLGILFDQKLNEGVPVPFFGIEVMTATAPAQLALRFKCPLIPVRIERVGSARFRVTVYPPIPLPDTGDRQDRVLAATRALNERLEEWIRERPAEWLWVHRRWPDEARRVALEATVT